MNQRAIRAWVPRSLLLAVTAISVAVAVRFGIELVDDINQSGKLFVAARIAVIAIALGLGVLAAYATRKPLRTQMWVLTAVAVPYLAAVTADVTIQVGQLVGGIAPRGWSARDLVVKQLKPDFDFRTVGEVVLDLRQSGQESYPWLVYGAYPDRGLTVGRKFFVIFGGIASAQTVGCNENGLHSRIQTDRFGLRNPDSVWDSSVPLDVAVVGDSFIYGACVDDGETIADVVRRRFPHTVNLGVPAGGILAEVGVLREYLQDRQVKYLVWGYFEADGLLRINKELAHPVTRKYIDPGFSQGLVEHRQEIDAKVRNFAETYLKTQRPSKWWYLSALDALKLKSVRKGLGARANSFRPPVDVEIGYVDRREPVIFGVSIPDDIGVFVQATGTILSEARRLNAHPIFVYVPSGDGMQARSAGGQSPAALLKSRITSHIASLSIDIVDIDARFRTHPDFLSLIPFREHGHYTAEGYQIFGEAILEKISEIESRSTSSDLPAEGAQFVAAGALGE